MNHLTDGEFGLLFDMNFTLLRSVSFAIITLMFIVVWALPGFGKLAGGGVPEWFAGKFAETFLATFPGLTISFYSIVILECLAALLAIISLFKGEWLRSKAPFFLQSCLLLSMLLFIQLLFGQSLLREFDSVAKLFGYFSGTLIALAYVTWIQKQSESL